MKPLRMSAILVFILSAAGAALATDDVKGAFSTYQSYYGVTERCVQLPPIPGADYRSNDAEKESALCRLDFYDHAIALCPKIWSTATGVIMHDISSGRFAGQRTEFQEKVCAGGKVAKYVSNGELARFQFTMNQEGGSAMFSPATLLYYHLSRYLDTTTYTPVAVWRTMDSQVLLQEVAIGAVSLTTDVAPLARINTGWRILVDVINDPSTYDRPGSYGTAEDLFTDDWQQVYGVLYDGSDPAYGPVVNGAENEFSTQARRYHWFQYTPAFIALATDAPIDEAIEVGLRDAIPAPEHPLDPAAEISAVQIAFWMRELSEIVLLDYIMGQRDRPGNIDYKPYYYWLEGSRVFRKSAKDRAPGDGEIPTDATLILRSRINDNGAAGRFEYENYAAQAQILQRLRHFDAKVYRRLLALDADFKAQGPIHRWLTVNLGLEPHQVQLIVDNTRNAATLLRFACGIGKLRFDLNPKRFFATGDTTPDEQSCTLQ